MKAEHRIKTSAAAEHRKELHTNALADRMGRFMQTVRQRPRGRTLLIWVVLLAVIVGVVVWSLWRGTVTRRNSETWKLLFEASPRETQYLIKEYPGTKQAEVAHLQLDWSFLWDGSAQVKVQGVNKSGKTGPKEIGILCGISNIKSVFKQQNRSEVIQGQRNLFLDLEADYDQLLQQIQNDPVLSAEVLYNKAVIQETLAVYDVKYLDKAKATFLKVKDDFKETGPGVMAEQRWKDAYENVEKFKDLRKFYQDFGEKVQVEKQGEIDVDLP